MFEASSCQKVMLVTPGAAVAVDEAQSQLSIEEAVSGFLL